MDSGPAPTTSEDLVLRHSPAVPDSDSPMHNIVGSVSTDAGLEHTTVPSGSEIIPALESSALVVSSDEPAVITDASSDPTSHSYCTHLKHNIRKSKVRTDGTVTYSVVRSSSTEPTSHIIVMQHHLWHQAMIDEYQALMQNKTWHLVPPWAGLNVIDCKWVFKLKHKSDGTIDCYKARLIAKGFKQQYGVDYDATFSSVVKPTIIRLLLSFVVTKGWNICQIDIQNAFLHGFLDEDVYMR
jgi:hypothetical protein